MDRYKFYFNATHKVWFAKWRESKGQWKSKQVPAAHRDESEARRWFEAWLAARQPSKPVDLPPATFADLVRRWIAWLDVVSKRSEVPKEARSWLKHWVLPFAIASVPVDRLSLKHCVAWVEQVKATGRAPYTIRTVVQRARTMMADARGHEWCDASKPNHFADDYLKRMTKGAEPLAGKDVIVRLAKEHAVALARHSGKGIRPGRHARNLLALCAGIRPGEASGLAWERLDLGDDPAVDVKRTLARDRTFREPKRKSFRVVPLHPLAAEALREWRRRWKDFVGREPKPSDPVFPDARGNYVVGAPARAFREDLIAYGLPTLFEGEHLITCHALRRTCLTLLTEGGAHPDVVKQIAGHAKANVTTRHYVADDMGRKRAAVMMLPFAAPKPQPRGGGKVVDLASRRRKAG